MFAPAPDLAALQRWMGAVLTHPGGAAGGVRSPQARAALPVDSAHLASVVLPSRTLDPLQRLDIYARMYFLRLRECLAKDFGAVSHALGPGAFDRLAAGYLRAHPSRFYNLNRFGAAFPRHVAGCRWIRRRRFVADLAKLEGAMTEVFDVRASAPVDLGPLRGLPSGEWGGVRFRLAPSVRLLAFEYPVNAYLQAVRDGKRPPIPRPAKSWVAVYRRDFVVWRMTLTRTMHRLLSALATGRTLGGAIATCLRARPELEKHAFRWFREWVSDGFFSEIAPSASRVSRRAPRSTAPGRRRTRAEPVEIRRFATAPPTPVAAEAAMEERPPPRKPRGS